MSEWRPGLCPDCGGTSRAERSRRGEQGVMSAQQLYRAYRPHAVELGRKHGVELHDALRALARVATQCPSGGEAIAAADFMRERVEQAIVQENMQRVDRREDAA